ncbi:MAG: hypothetical protein KDK07_03925 [Bauldia sp.]|nr:hypothetical protein [Bauldia sp.]
MFFDADKPVDNTDLSELEILVNKNATVTRKKGILYYTKGDTTLEVSALLKEKSDNTITGKVIAIAVKDENDDPIWDISGFKYDAKKLENQLIDGKLDKVVATLFKGKDTVWGSHFDDELHGFKGNDTIDGWRGNDRINGGRGKDSLQGRQGDDTFIFDQKLTKSNADKIVKFNVSEDSLELKQDIFTGLEKGKLHDDYFTVGKHAVGDTPQLIYQKGKGILSYDPDGEGSEKAKKFVTLDKNKDLTHDHIIVV